MPRTISVGELRQNPTAALDAVDAGATIVVLRNRRAIADLVPHRAEAGISGPELMTRLRLLTADVGWLDDLAGARAEPERDPWT